MSDNAMKNKHGAIIYFKCCHNIDIGLLLWSKWTMISILLNISTTFSIFYNWALRSEIQFPVFVTFFLKQAERQRQTVSLEEAEKPTGGLWVSERLLAQLKLSATHDKLACSQARAEARVSSAACLKLFYLWKDPLMKVRGSNFSSY